MIDLNAISSNYPQQQGESSSNCRWFLTGQIDPEQPNRKFPIHSTPFSVGRRSDSSLHLPDGCISKNHAEIIVSDDGRLMLREAGSTNGTFVNGEQISGEREIQENDLIHFAALVFRVGVQQESATSYHTVHEDVCDQALAMIQFEKLISDGGLYPHFQPIVQLEDQAFVGYEVLGRSRLFGLQTPYEMFHAASQLNMESQLSEAFRLRGVEIGTAFGPDSNLFVNTHPKELNNSALYDSLKEVREAAPEQKITLEIHEGAATNMNMMGELCSVLKDLNIMLAFDDFGVGKARLVELGEVRPDFLKFDMKLTNNIEHASIKRQELVALFATLVNNLGIQTLAEGVETRECHEILVQMGFQLGQGYYYGRPSPISKYELEIEKKSEDALRDYQDTESSSIFTHDD
ncbi:EAL domain-containing protein [Mariniblastus sp.]|nr:EAL domain-containing protein [Mariniblastus sp.]